MTTTNTTTTSTSTFVFTPEMSLAFYEALLFLAQDEEIPLKYATFLQVFFSLFSLFSLSLSLSLTLSLKLNTFD
jgi:hypothetical protein